MSRQQQAVGKQEADRGPFVRGQSEDESFGSNHARVVAAQLGGGADASPEEDLGALCSTMVALFEESSSALRWMGDDRASQVEQMVPTPYNEGQRLAGEGSAAACEELATESDRLGEGTASWSRVTQHAESLWCEMAEALFASGRMDGSGQLDVEGLRTDASALREELGGKGGSSRKGDPNASVLAALVSLRAAGEGMRGQLQAIRIEALGSRLTEAESRVAEIDELVSACDALDGLVAKAASRDLEGLFEGVGASLVEGGLDGMGLRARTSLGAAAQVFHERERSGLVARIRRLSNASGVLAELKSITDLEEANHRLDGAQQMLAAELSDYTLDAGDQRRPVLAMLDVAKGGERSAQYGGLDAAYYASHGADLVQELLRGEDRGLLTELGALQEQWSHFLGGAHRRMAPSPSVGLVERERVVSWSLEAADGVFEAVSEAMNQRIEQLSPVVDALLTLHQGGEVVEVWRSTSLVTLHGHEGTAGGGR